MAWVYILKCADGSYCSGLTRCERQIKGRLGAKKEALVKGDLKIDSGSFQMARRKGQRLILRDPSRLASLAPQGEDLRQGSLRSHLRVRYFGL
jgi:hypothetical protein